MYEKELNSSNWTTYVCFLFCESKETVFTQQNLFDVMFVKQAPCWLVGTFVLNFGGQWSKELTRV